MTDDFFKDKDMTWIVAAPPVEIETLPNDNKLKEKIMSDNNKDKMTEADKEKVWWLSLTFLGVGVFLYFALYDYGMFRFNTPQNSFGALIFAIVYIGVWIIGLNFEAILNFRVVFKFFTAVGEQGNANRSGAIVVGVLLLIATIIVLFLIFAMIAVLRMFY
jgi:hypothetical protein